MIVRGASGRMRASALGVTCALLSVAVAIPAGAQVPSVPPATDVTAAPNEAAAPNQAAAPDETVAPDEGPASDDGAAEGAAAKVVPPNAVVEQPRAFGYTVGDIFSQRVLLQLNGLEFEPAELPSTGRVGVWFERRAVRTERDASGRPWLRIDYQVMNSPQALKAVTLPAWKLKPAGSDTSAAGAAGTRGELRVGEWQLTVAPLTPERPIVQAGLGSLRPDKLPTPIPLAPTRLGFALGIAGLLLTVATWFGWLLWRNWRASRAQPFARALREMHGLDSTAPESWSALHRAFDATAGRVIRVDTLPQLFQKAPYFEPLRTQIEEFFQQSASRFFAGAAPTAAISAPALCRELRRIEKRHER